jgi:hypothetical protein
VHTQVSLLAATALAAAVSGLSGGTAVTTASNPLCYGATVKTQFTGTTNVGPICPVSWPGAVACDFPGTSLGTLFSVQVEVCLPSLQGDRVSSSGA